MLQCEELEAGFVNGAISADVLGLKQHLGKGGVLTVHSEEVQQMFMWFFWLFRVK